MKLFFSVLETRKFLNYLTPPHISTCASAAVFNIELLFSEKKYENALQIAKIAGVFKKLFKVHNLDRKQKIIF